MQRYRYRFDPKKIIGHFGGTAQAVKALHAIEVNVKLKTIQKQLERGSMPEEMIACLAMASMHMKAPLDLGSCVFEPSRESK